MFDQLKYRKKKNLLNALLNFPFEQPLGLTLEDQIPLHFLRRWTSGTIQPRDHPIAFLLSSLVEKGVSYDSEVPIASIKALCASQSEYLMHLDRMPERMRLQDDESFEPLDATEMRRLIDAVHGEFRLEEGRFPVVFQEWDGLYIGVNSGASRRFALWRRLTDRLQPIQIPVRVTPYRLSKTAVREMRERNRVIAIRANVLLWTLLHNSGKVADGFAYVENGAVTFFVLPYPHQFPASLVPSAIALHRRLDLFFDLGRYLVERECLAGVEGRHARSTRQPAES